MVAPNFSAAVGAGDKAYVVRDQDLNPHDTTILGGSDKITYVDSGVAGTPDVGDLGDTWDLAYPTITAALDAAVTSGEVIYVAPGHSETLTGAYSIDDAGVSIKGLGEGDLQPTIVLNHVDAQWDVSVADVLIENIKFESSLADVKIGIDIAAGGDGTHIKDCRFVDDDPGNVEFLIAIKLASGSDDVIVEGSEFFHLGGDADGGVDVTAGVVDNLQIIDCWFKGDYDTAPIYSDQINTNCLIKDNVVYQERSGGYAIQLTGAMTGNLVDNRLYSDSSATMLDPGSMICAGNIGTDAIDQQGIALPLSAETTDVSEEDDGSNLERIEYLQNKVDDILAGIKMAGGSVGDVYYVDSVAGASGNAGTSWADAEDTLANGYGDCTADMGDIVFLSPNHAEDITGATSLATAGVTVIGVGKGLQRATLTFTAGLSSLDVGAAQNTFENIVFYSTTASTSQMQVMTV
jgi:hypothetical protein